MRRRVLWIVGLTAALGVPATGVEAQTMRQKMQAACAADVATLCPAVASDEDRLKACLMEARSRVSAPCMAMVDASE